MKKLPSSDEQIINKVLKYQENELNSIKNIDKDKLEKTISNSEYLLNHLGYKIEKYNLKSIKDNNRPVLTIPTWEEMCQEASNSIKENIDIQDLFTTDELNQNELAIKNLNDEFKSLYKLDNIDIAISVFAGLLASIIDILLIGIPQKTSEGIKAGKLSDYVREWFDKRYPEKEMLELANSKISKVPYDAQDNRNTKINIEGLSAYYHRLLTLGHDPFLGFLFGISDILNGTMTSIDKKGNIVSQVVENYSDRKESDIFKAFVKQVIHFKSDITTSMGLPAPFMGLFNLLQFGKIGEEEQTIAEIVQGMYFEGYDFIQFCSSSISNMIIESIVRIFYSIKKIKNGNKIEDSIPFSKDKTNKVKLSTMLFISHSIACSVNLGKIYFSKNPLAINYPEWLTFAKYSYKQLKWALIRKPQLKEAYINNKLFDSLQEIYNEINETYKEYSEKYNIILN